MKNNSKSPINKKNISPIRTITNIQEQNYDKFGTKINYLLSDRNSNNLNSERMFSEKKRE